MKWADWHKKSLERTVYQSQDFNFFGKSENPALSSAHTKKLKQQVLSMSPMLMIDYWITFLLSSFARSFEILFRIFCELPCQYFSGLLMATRFYPSKAFNKTKTNFQNWIGKYFIKSYTVNNLGIRYYLETFFLGVYFVRKRESFKVTFVNFIIIIAQKRPPGTDDENLFRWWNIKNFMFLVSLCCLF